jgi:ribosomal protein S18 acetylase RimI-like enzyme
MDDWKDPLMRDGLRLSTATEPQVAAVARTLTCALAATDLARWLTPGSSDRARHLGTQIAILVRGRIAARSVRVAHTGGQIVGAAVWTTCRARSHPGRHDPITALIGGPGHPGPGDRLRHWLIRSHPAGMHHHLLAVGVLPGWQHRGIGRRLLAAWHAGLPDGPADTMMLAAPPLDRLATAAGYQSVGTAFAAVDLIPEIRVMRHRGPWPAHPRQRSATLAGTARRP